MSTRSYRILGLVATLFILTLLSCGTSDNSRAPSTTAESFKAARPFDLDSLLQSAQKDIDQFWRAKMTGYHSPKQVISYRTGIGSDCGYLQPQLGAVYCPASNSIYYNYDFLNEILKKYSENQRAPKNYGPIIVMAHEWGHLAQWQKYSDNSRRPTIEKEQEADCLAGAYTKYAREESQLLEDGDAEVAARTLYSMGDELSWFDPNAHGTPEMRVAAYTRGLIKGVDGCWGYTFPMPNNRAPTATLTKNAPAPNAISPDQFIRSYFDAINRRNYSYTWSVLSDEFKRQMNGPEKGGYQGYVDWWNTLDRVEIRDVQVKAQTKLTATVSMRAIYHYKNGSNPESTTDFYLAFDSTKNSWLFEAQR